MSENIGFLPISEKDSKLIIHVLNVYKDCLEASDAYYEDNYREDTDEIDKLKIKVNNVKFKFWIKKGTFV